jgi:N-methylhydantoinase B
VKGTAGEPDPISVEVMRNELNSAAEQMKIVLQRTSFSPIIYESLDCACALYDRRIRLLAQADTIPIFLGTMNACVEACLEAVGGIDELEPGDVFFNSSPYDIGSHPQDAAVVMPVFALGEVVGFAAIKAHHVDLGAKEPYVTDSVDMFQEGTIFPGVRLYRAGELQRDLLRTIVANSRTPTAMDGDINAEVAGVRTGAALLGEVVEKYGQKRFDAQVERLFEHGEAMVRSFLEGIPDGSYVGRGQLDSDGIADEPVPVEITVEIDGGGIEVQFGETPGEQAGPINAPWPLTVSAVRFAVLAIAASGEQANEGHFRALGVTAPEGSMYNPRPPAPIFLCFLAGELAIDVIHRALADAAPGVVAASSGGDICGVAMWGTDRDGVFWANGSDHLVGQGAGVRGDGRAPLMHISCSGGRNTPAEILEAQDPVRMEKMELAPDSGGDGEFRGGLGIDIWYRVLYPTSITAVVERTKIAPWGLSGGGPGRPNALSVLYPDGREEDHGKATNLELPPGALVKLSTGGGGGYGSPAERRPEAVRRDLEEGYVTVGQVER